MLVLTRREGETINLYIGDQVIAVRVLDGSSRGQVRIGIDAPSNVKIVREEIDARDKSTRVTTPEINRT